MTEATASRQRVAGPFALELPLPFLIIEGSTMRLLLTRPLVEELMKVFISLHETLNNHLKICFSEASGIRLLACHYHSIRQAYFNSNFFFKKPFSPPGFTVAVRWAGQVTENVAADAGADPEHSYNKQATAAGPSSKHGEEQDVWWLL